MKCQPASQTRSRADSHAWAIAGSASVPGRHVQGAELPELSQPPPMARYDRAFEPVAESRVDLVSDGA